VGVWALGDDGVFVSGGGGMSNCVGSVSGSKESSDVFSEGKCVLDNVIDDSDVGDEEVDELSLCGPTWNRGVTVSALGRETKRPCTRGCLLQASVEDYMDI
jgi:hypothetical protein